MRSSHECPKPPSDATGLDLETYSEATRRALLDIVVAVHFAAAAEAVPGDCYPDYTPDQDGLVVDFSRGRWLAGWRRLEETDSDLAALLPNGAPAAAASRRSRSASPANSLPEWAASLDCPEPPRRCFATVVCATARPRRCWHPARSPAAWPCRASRNGDPSIPQGRSLGTCAYSGPRRPPIPFEGEH